MSCFFNERYKYPVYPDPPFKVGDVVVVRSRNYQLNQSTDPEDRYCYATILYIHPVNGWSTFDTGKIKYSDWNSNIHTLEEWNS